MTETKQELITSEPKFVQPATDYELIRIENETISALAQAKPRNHKEVIQDLIAQIEAYPSFAESVMYAKPIGKDQNGRMQYARGLSIRAAEALAASWGYNRIEQKCEIIDDDRVRVVASFTDLQSGRIWRDEGILSKWYRKSGGGMARHSDDRFFNIVVKAELSKRVREAIMRSVPPGMRMELQQMAEKMVAKLLSDDTVQKIVQSFAAIGVTLVQLENLLEKQISKGWTVDDRVTLQQVYTAIKDGESTVGEVFGAKSDAQAASKATNLAEAVKEATK